MAVVVVRKRRIDVARIVRCIWMVVCGDVGSGKASCMGVTDGAVMDGDVPLTWGLASAIMGATRTASCGDGDGVDRFS